VCPWGEGLYRFGIEHSEIELRRKDALQRSKSGCSNCAEETPEAISRSNEPQNDCKRRMLNTVDSVTQRRQ